MKRGFTLIELLAVITILAIIALIATISVKSIISTSKSELSETQIVKIEEVARAYYLSEGMNEGINCVDIEELIDKGYIEGNSVKDPSSNNEITGSVRIKYESNKYSYKYINKSCLEPEFGEKNEDGEYVYKENPNDDFNCGDFVLGDVNNDGKTNVRDTGLIQQYLRDWDVDINICGADVNKDGIIGGTDILLLNARTNGWNVIDTSGKWDFQNSPETYKISYKDAGIEYNLKTCIRGLPCQIMPAKRSKQESKKYEFIGWQDDKGTMLGKEITLTPPNNVTEVVLTAIWQEKS